MFDDDETLIASVGEPSTDSDGDPATGPPCSDVTEPDGVAFRRSSKRRAVAAPLPPLVDPDADFTTLDEAPRTRTSPGAKRRAPPVERDADGTLPYEVTEVLRRRAPRAEADRIGTVIAGRYRVLRVLGEGGMGTVFEAAHVELGKRVAIKMLSGSGLVANHDEASQRFLREARAASAVESEHIVQVYDVGEDLRFGLYMVMELLQGEDLASAITARGSLRCEDAVGIAYQVSLALERAHRAGVVHRDLKPGNVFLCRTDDGSIKVKVLDFGIAKLVRDAQEARGVAITKRGTAVGTPQYMSPEQAQGLASVDERTDVYSLGALLHECIAGAPPYPELATYELTILKILTEAPPDLAALVPDGRPAAAALVRAMMARDPRDRPASAEEVRARIAAAFPDTASKRLVLAAAPPRKGRAPGRTGSGMTVDRRKASLPPSATSLARAIAVGAAVGGVLLAATVLVIQRRSPPAPVTLTAARATALVRPSAPEPTAPPPSVPVVPFESLPHPTATEAPRGDPAALVAEARGALDRGQVDRAASLASIATHLDPARADAWLTLGAAHELMKRHAAALRDYSSCAQRATGPRVEECRALLLK